MTVEESPGSTKMPKPLDFANSNLFNAKVLSAEENGTKIRDAILREYK